MHPGIAERKKMTARAELHVMGALQVAAAGDMGVEPAVDRDYVLVDLVICAEVGKFRGIRQEESNGWQREQASQR